MSIQLVNNGNRVFDTHLRNINRSDDALWILGQVSGPNYSVKTLNIEVQFKISNKVSYCMYHQSECILLNIDQIGMLH